jgi:hypothetical protein
MLEMKRFVSVKKGRMFIVIIINVAHLYSFDNYFTFYSHLTFVPC